MVLWMRRQRRTENLSLVLAVGSEASDVTNCALPRYSMFTNYSVEISTVTVAQTTREERIHQENK